MVRSTELGKARPPLHGIKNALKGGKLCFTYIQEWREITLFSEELRMGEDKGLYEYQALDGVGFKSGPVMKQANEALFAMKKKAKAEGKNALEKAIKVVINSMYGFWGLRTERRESVKIYPSDNVPVYDFLARNALLEEADHGQYTCLRVLADMGVVDFNVAIAAAITSYARMRLWDLMDDVQRHGGEVYSCDTDSVTTNFDLSQFPEVLAKYIPDWNTKAPGTELGSLKCECTDEIEKVLKKQGLEGSALDEAMELERGSKHWKPIPFYHPEGTLVNAANKLYALRTRLRRGNEIELCKAKGMSQKDSEGNVKYKKDVEGNLLKDDQGQLIPLLQFTDYVAMFDPDNPRPLTDPSQMQFRMPSYCVDGGLPAIRKMHVKKTVYAVYDKGEKGEVIDGSCRISPYSIGANAYGKTTAFTVGSVPKSALEDLKRPREYEIDSDSDAGDFVDGKIDSDAEAVWEYEIDSDAEAVSEYEIDSDSDVDDCV